MLSCSLQVHEDVRSSVIPVLVWAEGIASPRATTESPSFLSAVVDAAQAAGTEYVPANLRKRVRNMLRHGKYKPSGRGKPASEYLLQAALAGDFPLVNPPVDVNNAISLESGLPGSIFDADLSGCDLLLRWGVPEESYIFNPTGQSIDLEDLLVICRRIAGAWIPCGNPVKDSMSTKTRSETRNVVAVLYSPTDEPIPALESRGARFAELLESHCGASSAGYLVYAT